MLAIISPAKTLDFDRRIPAHVPTMPQFLDQSEVLVGLMRTKSVEEVQALMGISTALAELNHERFRDWSRPFSEDNARAALFAFKGDVYEGIGADRYEEADLEHAQRHLRILSGLYGLLRPLDLIQPYRLEMRIRLPNPAGRDLYAFWRETLTQATLEAASQGGASPLLVNLASKEYASAIDTKHWPGEVITPQFLDLKNGDYRMISFYAKKARGMMVDYLIRHRITQAEDLKSFDTAGYRFSPAQSQGNTWVFLRDQPVSQSQ